MIGESQDNTKFSLSKNLKSTKITKPLSSSFCFASGLHSCDFTAALAALRSFEPESTLNFSLELNMCHFTWEGKKKMHKPQPWPCELPAGHERSLSINLPTIKWHYFSRHTGDPPAVILSSRQCLCFIISFLFLSFPSHLHSNKSSSFLKFHVQKLDRWFLNTLLLVLEVKEGKLKPVNACFFSLMCVPSLCLGMPWSSRLLLTPCPHCLILLWGQWNAFVPFLE